MTFYRKHVARGTECEVLARIWGLCRAGWKVEIEIKCVETGELGVFPIVGAFVGSVLVGVSDLHEFVQVAGALLKVCGQ